VCVVAVVASCGSAVSAQSASDLFASPIALPSPASPAPSVGEFQCAAASAQYPGIIFGVRELPTSGPSQICAWRWLGGTEFSAPAVFEAGLQTRAVAVADFVGSPDDAPYPDMAATNSSGDDGTILLNDIANGASVSTISTGDAPRTVRAADMDNDGDLDIVWVNQGDNSTDGIEVLLNNGSGAFTPTAAAEPAGNNPYGLVIADFNDDGDLDVATTNYVSGDVSVLLGNGDGTLQAETRYNIGTLPIPSPTNGSTSEIASGIAVADFNNDGDLDLAATCYAAGTSSVLLGNGDGTFQTQGMTTGFNTPAWNAVGDLNLDGNIDMVLSLQFAGEISVCFGLGNGAFQAPQYLSVGDTPWYVEIADINTDGAPDIIVTDSATLSGDSTVWVLFNNGPQCNLADIAQPFGVLDLADQTLFVNEYSAGCP
jgi:hypothetical protein